MGFTAHKIVSRCLVNIYLPNEVAFAGVRVTKGVLGDVDLLIGMDIISQGDFSVTCPQGKTKFSFRLPSQANIDFVTEAQNPRSRAGSYVSHKKRAKNSKHFGRDKKK